MRASKIVLSYIASYTCLATQASVSYKEARLQYDLERPRTLLAIPETYLLKGCGDTVVIRGVLGHSMG